MRKFSAETLSHLSQVTDAACADQAAGIPGAVIVVVGKDGKELFGHAAGKRGTGSDEPMTLDSVFWIASCTKVIVGVAAMQLVEKGILKLDDSAQVETLCPELKDVQVLQADGTLVPKKRGITLRMLLSHTAGFGYTFFNERLRDFGRPTGWDEFSGLEFDIKQPLVHQPGENWEYGVSIDWAGKLVEKSTGVTLEVYCQENIYAPLGLKNISMKPHAEMLRNLAYMHSRVGNGRLSKRDHLLRRPLLPDETHSLSFLYSGGAGCFARPQEYAQILATLLNDGTSPTTGAQILAPSTVESMFENQIPQFPNFARQGIPAAKPDLTNPVPELYPVPGNGPQGWGLTFMLSGAGATGRSASTAFWAGLANLWWWCDREKGVAGIVATQILPFGDAKVLGLWGAIESAVYQAL
ncbi:beta-lactamase/transpeptidase-like protein [Bimuria novae-zelandiae CBS 107.79]|uniref:Beta-lactamase/transpeptidase-like protein n=1 Tax=Bimuria novae-zelandiae CBS 107.79 TaxID=1447943 RepID=A0A6A5V6N9_9PLEO|nr:beta-lactamase/transpeptidase-like protein [Bimuria novae-zelandiae CBS 107.79]